MITLSVKPIRANGKISFCVDLRKLNTSEKRKYFKTETEAQNWADNKNLELKTSGTDSLDITEKDRRDLRDFKRRFPGVELSELMEFYEKFARISSPKLLTDAVDLALKAKRSAGRREVYTDSLEWLWNNFAAGNTDKQCHEITREDVTHWLDSSGWALSTQKYNLQDLRTLFVYCIKQGWCKHNPCEGFERITLEEKPPVILTVEQSRLLMDRAQSIAPQMLAYLALALFCGIRPDEIKRLSPADIDLERGIVEVKGAKAKTRKRRLVTINETAMAWLKIAPPLTKPSKRQMRKIRYDFEVVGKWKKKKWVEVIPWYHDILRHTAASNLYVTLGATKTAQELGHSEQILFRHYRELVAPKEAKGFFGIAPKK